MSHIQEIAKRLQVTSAHPPSVITEVRGRKLKLWESGVYLITGSIKYLNDDDLHDFLEDSNPSPELEKLYKTADGAISGYSSNHRDSGGFVYSGAVKPYKNINDLYDFLGLLPKLPSFAGFTFKAYSDVLFTFSKGNNIVVIALVDD